MTQEERQTCENERRFQQHLKMLKGLIKKYKNRWQSLGYIKILEFLTDSNTLHDVKLLFTDIVIE